LRCISQQECCPRPNQMGVFVCDRH
jgi:hypothetical protein